MSARLPDWEDRLAAYLAGVRERPHAFGAHDCALHGAAAVEAVTGVDHGAPFRGRYTTERGAALALRRHGAGTIEATFDRHLASVPVALARRGDLVMSDGSIGVCIGGEAMLVGRDRETDGLVRVARRDWSKAWAVG